MSSLNRVSIVIVFKEKTTTYLESLLQDLYNHYNNSGVFSEIILVNSSDLDLSQCFKQYYPVLKIINTPNIDIGDARNIGCMYAENDLVLFIDSDCRIHPNFFNGVKNAIETIKKDDLIACIGGPVECVPSSSIIQKYLDYTPFSQFPRYNRDYVADWRTLFRRHHPNTCNLLLKRSVLNKIGGFWRGFGEDVYILLKFTKNGYRVGYLSSMKIYHNHPNNVLRLVKVYFRNGRSAIRILCRFPLSSLVIFRLTIYISIAAIITLSLLINPIFLIAFPALSITYYTVKTRNYKMIFVYSLLDYLLQIVYILGGLYEILRAVIDRVFR